MLCRNWIFGRRWPCQCEARSVSDVDCTGAAGCALPKSLTVTTPQCLASTLTAVNEWGQLMIRTLCYCTSLLLLHALPGVGAEPAWSLPDDPQAVVVELSYAQPSSRFRTDALTVRRDGSLTAGDPRSAMHVRGRLSEDDLQALLHDLIVRERALELSSEALEAAITAEGRRTGKNWRTRRPTNTIVRLTLAGGSHEFVCNDPELLRTRFPRLQELNRVCAIIRRLQNIAAVAQVGGRAEAERLAELATSELKRQNAPDVRITSRDLLHVRGAADDLRQVQFVVEPALHGESGDPLHVSVMESPGQAPRISLTPVSGPL